MNRAIDIPRELSLRMTNMSFVCACMIVLFHATPAPESGTWMWWLCRTFGREGICSMAVPFFFLASGFFVAGHLEGVGEWRHEICKRVRTVIIPFFIWLYILTAFAFAIWYLKANVFMLKAKGNPLGLPTVELVLKMMGVHPFEDIGVLWYLRTLFMFVVALPVFGWLSRHWRVSLPVLFAVLCVFEVMYVRYSSWNFYYFFDRVISIRGAFYFLAGVALRVYFLRSLGVIRGQRGFLPIVVAIAGFAVAAGLGLNGWSCVACIIRAVMAPIAILGLFAIMPTRNLPPVLSGTAFPMYLMHNMFLSVSSLMLVALGVRDLCGVGMLGIFIFRTLFAIGASLVVITLLRRVSVRWSSVIFGGR